jgi:hypothetical protein
MKCVWGIGVVLLLSAAGAYAQSGPPPAAVPTHVNAKPTDTSAPCAEDGPKICGSVSMGGGRRLICMNEHLSQLTPACRNRIRAIYALETKLAAGMHMTLPQFMEWGQNFHEHAVTEHQDYKIKPAGPKPATAVQTQSQPKQSGSEQN